MKGMRIFAALLATAFIVFGFFLAVHDVGLLGSAIFLSGSIILSAVLITSGILEIRDHNQL